MARLHKKLQGKFSCEETKMICISFEVFDDFKILLSKIGHDNRRGTYLQIWK